MPPSFVGGYASMVACPQIFVRGHAHNLIERSTRLTIEGGEKNRINSYLYSPAKEKTRRRKHDVGNKLTPFGAVPE